MSRTISNTVDYFPHFAKHGKTLFILKSRFGNDGYAFWFQLLELLSQSENHFYDCRSEELWQYLLSFCGSNAITGTEILDLLAKLGNIDTELWQRRVIWCQALVDNFTDIYKKRGRGIPLKPDVDTNNAILDTSNALSGTEMLQSKVKESKVKETILNNTTTPAPSSPPDELSLSSQKENEVEVNLYTIYQQEIGEITEFTANTLKDFEETFGPDEVVFAIKEAVRQNKKNLRYIQGVLENRHNGHKKGDTNPDKFIKGKFGHAVVQNKEDLDRVLSLRKERNAPPIKDSS